jgi:hypothetical protein
MRRPTTAIALVLALAVEWYIPMSSGRAAEAGSWLDRRLANWNAAAAPVPTPVFGIEARDEIVKRCQVPSHQATSTERRLAAAGWIPFWHLDRQLVRGEVEIVGGMAAADAQCEPAAFNLFVFVADRFAGTLSPVSMISRKDGSVGAVRFSSGEALAVEFIRYLNDDTACCPSEHVTVRYRIDRSGPSPAVVPVELVRRVSPR